MSTDQPQDSDEQPQQWVIAYCANLRFLGVQMGEAMRKFQASMRDL